MQSAKKSITPVVLPHDLIPEILSFLPVKSLVRFRSVCKSWKTLIYDPSFVKLHLKKSPTRNPLFTLTTHHLHRIPGCKTQIYYSVVPYPISGLIENPSFSLSVDPYYSLKDKECSRIVGTCNGLICLSNYSYSDDGYWLRLWNPATRTISPKFGYNRDFHVFKFKFGYDNSTGKYKVVAFRYIREQKSNVRILSFGDNVWRDIEGLPAVPVHLHLEDHEHAAIGGVYLSGSLNWLGIHNMNQYNNDKDITVAQFVIVSLDLGTETYNQYMLPHGVDEVLSVEATVSLLGGCLCLSYSYKETDFVIWKMKKFGVEDSWTQFLKISFQNLQVKYNFWYSFQLVPLLLFENGDTLVLGSSKDSNAIIYNLCDNRVERIKFTAGTLITSSSGSTRNRTCWYMAMDFVESLVSTF